MEGGVSDREFLLLLGGYFAAIEGRPTEAQWAKICDLIKTHLNRMRDLSTLTACTE